MQIGLLLALFALFAMEFESLANVTDKSASLYCDFEEEDICGWRNEGYNTWEWTSGADFRTKQANIGHFMSIDSTDTRYWDIPRLLSPFYAAELTKGTCCHFRYYMNGATNNTFNVYVKPASIDMYSLVVSSQYLVFEQNGDQGNAWKTGSFVIPDWNESFQILIEVTGRDYHLSDIAVDDVKLVSGCECSSNKYATAVSTTNRTTTQKTTTHRATSITAPARKENEPFSMLVILVFCMALLALLLAILIVCAVFKRQHTDTKNESFFKYQQLHIGANQKITGWV